MKGKCLSMLICMLFISSAFSIAINGRDYGKENTGENVIATITYKSNECSIATLQPIVVITQPADGAVVTDPHLTVLGYATDEIGMNYWEWEWHWKGGSYSNSSYFETAEYVEFKIDIYGLHPGWNLIIVRFKNIYGAMGEDNVNVTYVTENNPPNKPSKPEGPTKGKVKETLYFNTVTTDPDGDSLEYLIDWEMVPIQDGLVQSRLAHLSRHSMHGMNREHMKLRQRQEICPTLRRVIGVSR